MFVGTVHFPITLCTISLIDGASKAALVVNGVLRQAQWRISRKDIMLKQANNRSYRARFVNCHTITNNCCYLEILCLLHLIFRLLYPLQTRGLLFILNGKCPSIDPVQSLLAHKPVFYHFATTFHTMSLSHSASNIAPVTEAMLRQT